MGYKILYTPQYDEKYPIIHKSVKHTVLTIVISCLIIFGIGATAFTQNPDLSQWLLPGDTEQIQRAASQMIDHIRAGDSVADSFMVFCQEIIGRDLYAT